MRNSGSNHIIVKKENYPPTPTTWPNQLPKLTVAQAYSEMVKLHRDPEELPDDRYCSRRELQETAIS